jgi:transcriptional regulator with XRE-family HTH domain
MASAPIILGKVKSEVLAGIGLALSQIRLAERLTIDDMAEKVGRSDEMMAQYLSGQAEMGVTAWLRACAEWPDLPARVDYNLDGAEKAFRAKQRSLTLPMPEPQTRAA